jgi:membrane protease YdiL (CAAX protease family)
MFLLTWPTDLAYSGLLPFKVPFLLYLFLGWGFVLASVTMTELTLGKEGVISLLKRYLQWRVQWRWYLAALLLEPLLITLGVYGNALVTGVAPDYSQVMATKIFGQSATLWLFILPFFLTDFISNGEEIGWRGYVLPRLQARYSVLTSTLILGVIWGFWHLPKYLTHFSLVSFACFMVHSMAAAFLYTWIFNGTKGSLLLVTLLHASSNATGIFVPMANTLSSENFGAYIGYILFEVIAAILVMRMMISPVQHSQTEPITVQP